MSPDVNQVKFVKMHMGQTTIEVHPSAYEAHLKAGWELGEAPAADPITGAASQGQENSQVVELVSMQHGIETTKVNPATVEAHKKAGWVIVEDQDYVGNIPLEELIRLAREWHETWAADRGKDGWNKQEIAAGRKEAVIEQKLVEVSKNGERLMINEVALAGHIFAGWTPKAHSVEMKGPGGQIIPIRTNSIEHLLEAGWEIVPSHPKVITPAVESPLVPMWKKGEKIEVHVSTMLEHAKKGWSIVPLELVLKDGQVREIPVDLEKDYLVTGWELVNSKNDPKTESKASTASGKESTLERVKRR